MSSSRSLSGFSRPMPPENADLETTWQFLKEGFDDIMENPRTDSYSRRTGLYIVMYNYCTSLRMHGNLKAGQAARSADLYSKLTKYFAASVRAVRDDAASLADENLLRYYAKEWNRYTAGAKTIGQVSALLNRYWVKCEKDERRKGVSTVYAVKHFPFLLISLLRVSYKRLQLALVQWKAAFFYHSQVKDSILSRTIIEQIEKQRNGETIDESLLKRIIDSFISLGIDDTIEQTLDVYKEHFESPFIAATETYYKEKCTSFPTDSSVLDYLKTAEERLKEEEERVDRYLHSCTPENLVVTCKRALVAEHVGMIWNGFRKLLDSDNFEDCQRMYAPLIRAPGRLKLSHKMFEEDVRLEGLAAVEKIMSGGDNCAKRGLDPRAYVGALLEVHKRNSKKVNRGFGNESGFVASLDKAFLEIVNQNTATGSSISKSPELLVKYVDALLRGDKISEELGLDGAINDVMIIFKYIEDKDIFLKFYTNRFLKRITQGASVSDESEASMISKLKKVCGSECMRKLERMFADVNISNDLTESFNRKAAGINRRGESDLAFSVLIFGTNVWPLISLDTSFIIPKEILPIRNRFQRYYQQEYSGRRLTWLWAHGKNELRANYTSPQKLIFTTSSFQMAVLVQYNDYDSLAFEELQSNTGIPEDLLKQVLAILCKACVLLNDGEGEPYSLNANYKSKKIKVNLNHPIKLAEKEETTTEVLRGIDEERLLALQAVIVRIMKARKTLKDQELVQEVISHASKQFSPKLPDIKKAIDTLLEKEYIERVDGSPEAFAYVA